jgi:hypothetical protein
VNKQINRRAANKNWWHAWVKPIAEDYPNPVEFVCAWIMVTAKKFGINQAEAESWVEDWINESLG